MRALAVSSKSRSPALPDTPSMTEAGYPEVVGESWFAAVVPAGTPKEIIALLQREILTDTVVPMHAAVALGTSAVVAAIMFVIATRLFSNESVLFRT